MVRKLIKKIGYKLIKFIVPEINILRRNLYWDYIDYSLCQNSISKTVYIASPAHISYSTIGEVTIEVKKEFDISGNLSSLKETVNNGKDKDGTDIIITDVTYNSDGTVKTELKRTNNNRKSSL